MASSSLSLDYQAIVKALSKVTGWGDVYYAGTVTVASGVVTLTSGSFPDWAASAAININGTHYNVSTRGSSTAITLADLTVNVPSASMYLLARSSEENFADTLANYDEIINRGLRNFYFPPPMPRGEKAPPASPHQWSFLRPTQTFSTIAAQQNYDLPDDFGQVSSEWAVRVGSSIGPIRLISNAQMQATRLTRGTDGVPKYATVSQKADFDPEVGQRFEVTFAPIPDAAYQIEYTYLIEPSSLNPTNRFPLGGAVHSETILASILAQAELSKDCEGGQYANEFTKRLASSVSIDTDSEAAADYTYSLEPFTQGSYEWLQQEVGAAIELSPNPVTWGWTERQRVDSLIQRGLRMFYQPLGSNHQWSFMRPLLFVSLNAPYSTGTITVVDGVATLAGGTFPLWAGDGVMIFDEIPYRVKARMSSSQVLLEDLTVDADALTEFELRQDRYTLPDDYAGLDGPLSYRRNTNARPFKVRLVDDYQLRSYDQSQTAAGSPLVASITVDKRENNRTVRRLNFWPQPDVAYTLIARYKIAPEVMSPGDMIIGGQEHYETVLAACLAAAGKDIGFATKLLSSINVDLTEHAPPTVGANRDRSDYDWYDREWYRDRDGVTYDDSPA